jgi:hypothetical protein
MQKALSLVVESIGFFIAPHELVQYNHNLWGAQNEFPILNTNSEDE